MRYRFFFQAEDGIRDIGVTGVQTCALPILGCAGAGLYLAGGTLINSLIVENRADGGTNCLGAGVYTSKKSEFYNCTIAYNTGKVNLRNRNADRKSTRLNSSHANISYAVFCLKKKNT